MRRNVLIVALLVATLVIGAYFGGLLAIRQPGLPVALSVTNIDNSTLTVQFRAEVVGGGGAAPYTYVWELGDGTSADAASNMPTSGYTKRYSAPGTYTARVVVTESTGISGMASVTFAVGTSAPPLEIAMTASASGLNVTGHVAITGGVAPYSIQWLVGATPVSGGVDMVYTLPAPGAYGVRVTVRDATFSQATDYATVTGTSGGPAPPPDDDVETADEAVQRMYMGYTLVTLGSLMVVVGFVWPKWKLLRYVGPAAAGLGVLQILGFVPSLFTVV